MLNVIISIFAMYLARFLDPLSALVAGIYGFRYGDSALYSVFVIGFVTSIIIEIILTQIMITRDFGDGLVVGLLASSTHAYIGRLIFLRRKNRPKE